MPLNLKKSGTIALQNNPNKGQNGVGENGEASSLANLPLVTSVFTRYNQASSLPPMAMPEHVLCSL